MYTGGVWALNEQETRVVRQKECLMKSLEFTEIVTPHGYQPRGSAVRVTTAKMRRFCRSCNSVIPAGIPHITADSHLSSGYRSDLHICRECMIKLLGGL